MALFGKADDAEQTAENTAQGDDDYFAGLEGQGLEGFSGDNVSTAYLSMVQPGSTAALTDEPGSWRNSATGENFGPAVRVVPMAFKTVWTERDSKPPYITVGRYEPHSINVDISRPKPGQRGFPKMTNPETGNEVQELFIYACMLEDRPEDGILYFSPTVGSMKACKAWNAQLRAQRLPNGKLAPIFAFAWELRLELQQNPVKPAEKITRFVKAVRGNLVAKDLFVSYVQPQLQSAANIELLAAPEASGDVEE
jgi:hypothetical protein